MSKEISEEEFSEWLQHPVTKLVRGFCLSRIEDLKTQWIEGAFTADNEFGTKFLNGQANGAAKALQAIVDLDEITLNGEMSND